MTRSIIPVTLDHSSTSACHSARVARRTVRLRSVLQPPFSEREYDLRSDGDLLSFQIECLMAGVDWRGIRNTTWSGIFKKLEHGPMFQRPPLGYMTLRTIGEHGRVIKTPAKNPEHASIILEIEQAFDNCSTLGEVVRRLHTRGVERPGFRGRGGTTAVWTIQSLRYLLGNPI